MPPLPFQGHYGGSQTSSHTPLNPPQLIKPGLLLRRFPTRPWRHTPVGRERPPPETRSGGRRPIGAGSVLRPGAPIPHFPVACALPGARNGPETLPYRSKSGPTSGRLAPRRAQSARGSPGKPVARGVEKGRPKHMGAGKSMPNPTRSSETNHRPSPTETRNRNASGVTRS